MKRFLVWTKRLTQKNSLKVSAWRVLEVKSDAMTWFLPDSLFLPPRIREEVEIRDSVL